MHILMIIFGPILLFFMGYVSGYEDGVEVEARATQAVIAECERLHHPERQGVELGGE